MKVVAFCVVLLVVIQVTLGFNCPADYCDHIDCSKGLTAEQCEGSMIAGTSECGCCATCYKFLPLWSDCEVPPEPIPLTDVRKVCAGMARCVENKCMPIPI